MKTINKILGIGTICVLTGLGYGCGQKESIEEYAKRVGTEKVEHNFSCPAAIPAIARENWDNDSELRKKFSPMEISRFYGEINEGYKNPKTGVEFIRSGQQYTRIKNSGSQ